MGHYKHDLKKEKIPLNTFERKRLKKNRAKNNSVKRT